MKNFEYNKRLVVALAAAAYFSQEMNAKINDGKFELRESNLTVKAIVEGKSDTVELLKSGNRIAGFNDFDSGNRLESGRAFLANELRVDQGSVADAEDTAEAGVFGGKNFAPINESVLTIKTDNRPIYNRSVTAVTKGVSSDNHKQSMPGTELNKVIALKDNASQSITLTIPQGMAVTDTTAGQKAAIAVRLDGFEIVTL